MSTATKGSPGLTGAARVRAERPVFEFSTGVFDYAPAPETADHVRLQKRYDLFVGGKAA